MGRERSGSNIGRFFGHHGLRNDGPASYFERYYSVLLLNLCNRQIQAPAGPCLHRRFRVIGKRCNAGSTGESVSGARIITLRTVGLFKIHILMACRIVYHILIPDGGIIIDMPDKHTMSGNIGIPPCLLSVFEEEELILIASTDNTALIAADVLQSNVSRTVELCRFYPSERITFIDGIKRRRAAAIIIRAIIQHRPCARCESAGIAGGIEVGQTHHVRKLVNERSDAIGAGAFPLITTGIAVQLNAVENIRRIFR